jgi:4-hydroxybenzoate polyprenyltransferase
MIGLFPFLTLYPFMKRWTYWPQAWLGPTMNWGILVAWINVTSRIDYALLGLVLLSASWCVELFSFFLY